ncbi:unnamed protein product [Closterium sp. Naga37s-1]|nr:unnamed protein product [Closterium sp. Naga37s-1]
MTCIQQYYHWGAFEFTVPRWRVCVSPLLVSPLSPVSRQGANTVVVGGEFSARIPFVDSSTPYDVCPFPPCVPSPPMCALSPHVCPLPPCVPSPPMCALSPHVCPLLPFPDAKTVLVGWRYSRRGRQDGAGGVEDAKTVLVGWRYSRWSPRVRTWQPFPHMCVLFPTPLKPPPPLSPPLPGRQDGGGGVEVHPLEPQSAHMASPSCRLWRHSWLVFN